MFATQVLPSDVQENYVEEEEDSEIVGFLLVENQKHEVKKGETKIGRDSTLCSIVIENFTISKIHAVIESEGIDDTFIYDVGSTNQTKLGKKVLKPHCRYKLENDSKITFGNIISNFILPPELKTDNFSALDELEDIFDAATQITVPQSESSKVEKQPEDSHIFKIPQSIPSGRTERVSTQSTSKVTEDRSESQNSVPVLESSIFNLSTQCQILENGDTVSSDNRNDKFNSLLNDGQDEILCTFMSLNSPQQVKIKTEVSEDNLTEIFDAPTQAPLVEECNKEHHENSAVASSSPERHDSSPEHDDDDFIQTQKFSINAGNSCQENSGKALESFSTEEGRTEEEMILTQRFEFPVQQEKSSEVNDDQDLMATQIYPVENQVDSNCTQRNNEDDLICTQVFNDITAPKHSKQIDDDDDDEFDDDEDFIATQPVKLPQSEKAKTHSRESSPDLLDRNAPEDQISTQIFQNDNGRTLAEFSEQINSFLSNDLSKKNIADSSGDETESDLEILLDKNEATRKTEEPKPIKVEFEPCDSVTEGPVVNENDDTNSSYIFLVDSEPTEEKKLENDADSDATDCDEIEIINAETRIKQEVLEKIEFEDTQVLTLTAPDNSSPNKTEEHESMCWSPLSLEMPNTQDIESTLGRLLDNKNAKIDNHTINSKLNEKRVDSPLKRPGSSRNVEEIPTKKSKTRDKSLERQLSKVCQDHDIGQIQPNRTRSSVRTIEISSESDRKLRHNRTSSEEKKKEIEKPVERLLRRSSRRNSETKPVENLMCRPKRTIRLRSTEYFSNPCVNVVFTGFYSDSLEKIITELGGKKTDDLTVGEVVVADKVRRTVKFLCAIGLSIPIASPQWLFTSKREKRFLNPWDFILKDEESEEKWNFKLKNSLEKAKKGKLLQGLSIYATKSTKPPVKDLLDIVECCGGTPLPEPPETWPKKTVVVTCLEDKKYWPLAKFRSIKIVHYEFILSAVLRQKLDYKTFKLR